MRFASRRAHQRIDHDLQHRHAGADDEQGRHDPENGEQRKPSDREVQEEGGQQRRLGATRSTMIPAGIETRP